MAVATKPKAGGTTKPGPGRPRTAKAPTGPWTQGRFAMKGNGKILLEQTIPYSRLSGMWSELSKQMAKCGPGKFTITIETTA